METWMGVRVPGCCCDYSAQAAMQGVMLPQTELLKLGKGHATDKTSSTWVSFAL